MTKTVFLLRHATAADHSNDRMRSLTKVGQRQAESIGQWMKKNFLPIDIIFSSSAKRARTTAELCAEAAGHDKEIQIIDHLYDADVTTFLEIIRGLDDEIRAVMMVGHNPEISGVVRALMGQSVRMENSELVGITLVIASWSDVGNGTGVFEFKQLPI